MDMRRESSEDRSPPAERLRLLLRRVLAAFFVIAGVLHFLKPAFYLQIMPPYLPGPLVLVYLSGACEIVGGCAVLWAATRRWAGLALIVLLIAVFPANIQMAVHPEPLAGWDVPLWLLWLRLPMQGVLIAWVWWVSNSQAAPKQPGRR